VPTPATPPAANDDPQFRQYYASARAHLATGDFAQAASEFAQAAQVATSPCNRALAEEQRALAQEWAERGLAFVKRSALGESNLTAKAVDVRTSDEIVSLYGSAILYGLGTGAWIDELSLGSSPSSAAVILPPLIAAGAAAGGVAALDSGRGLRYGAAQSIVSGLNIGLYEGIVWDLFQASQGGPSWSPQTTATFIWGAATAGAVAGGILGQTVTTTPGRASFAGSAGLWGGAVAGLSAGTFAVSPNGAAPALAAAGVGLTAGSIAGILTAGTVSPSIARVRFIDLGGIAGFLISGGLYLAAANNNADPHAFSGIAALGTVGGLVTGWLATRSMPRDEGVSKEPTTNALEWRPTVVPAPGGGMIAVQGRL
jgi:hypothetical protein